MIIRKIYICLFTLILCLNWIVHTHGQNNDNFNHTNGKIQNLEIPKLNIHEAIVKHTGYSLSFNDDYKLANWVAYFLSRGRLKGESERTNSFIPDPSIANGTATNEDYYNSGFDRGHLAPAADMTWSPVAMAESFYYSNMSPQDKSFNRGIWKKLETLVRTWADEYDTIYIVTGPILKADLPRIGIHHIGVPQYFYKVILDYKQHGHKGIGFIIPNEKSDRTLQDYAVTIDSVEVVTGIDFFPSLPDVQEKVIESTLIKSEWSWQTNKTSESTTIKSTDKVSHSASVQCSEILKNGERCKRMTKSPNGKCWQHGGD